MSWTATGEEDCEGRRKNQQTVCARPECGSGEERQRNRWRWWVCLQTREKGTTSWWEVTEGEGVC